MKNDILFENKIEELSFGEAQNISGGSEFSEAVAYSLGFAIGYINKAAKAFSDAFPDGGVRFTAY